jgi:glycosyltransferase involved in cell wall biosynthesis
MTNDEADRAVGGAGLNKRVDALEAKLTRLTHDLAEARSQILTLERRTLVSKFTPQLWRHRQYTPRRVRVPPWYLGATAPKPAPAIAIVTPSLNQGDFISRTIDSIAAQGYPNLAYHVQDGQSNDDTSATLRRFAGVISYACLRDQGQANAINLGFSVAKGDIMGYLNSDDVLLPGTLAYVASFFKKNPKVDIVYGHRVIIDQHGDEVGRWVLPPHDDNALKWIDIVPQETMFWRRHVWDKLGSFDETFQCAFDWEFLLRAQANGFHFARLPRFLGCFRVHDAQKTTTMIDAVARENACLRERYLGRKVGPEEVERALRPYLRRHVLFHRLYKFPLLRY